MKNLNPFTNPITTISGVLFILLGLFMYALPMVMVVHKDFTAVWWGPLIPIGVGALFVLSPESLVRGADKTIDKFTDNDKPAA